MDGTISRPAYDDGTSTGYSLGILPRIEANRHESKSIVFSLHCH